MQALHVLADADDFSDKDLDSDDEACAPWYGVFAGEHRLPAPAGNFRIYQAAAVMVSLVPIA